MPYEIKKRGKKFCVINKETGKVKSCKFTSRHAAIAYMRALYRAESGKPMTGKPGKPFRVRRGKKKKKVTKKKKTGKIRTIIRKKLGIRKSKKTKKDWERKVDKGMKSFGDVDRNKKQIRINPKKKELLNTIIHEELHKRYPSKPEKWIRKKTEEKEKRLSIRKALNLLKKYKE